MPNNSAQLLPVLNYAINTSLLHHRDLLDFNCSATKVAKSCQF